MRLTLALSISLVVAYSLSMPCQEASANQQSKGASSLANQSEKEKSETRKSLRKKRDEILISRKSILGARDRISKKLAHLNAQIRSMSQTKARPLPRSMQAQFLKEELENELKLVETDLSLKDLDKEKLAIDKKLFELESDRFKSQYKDSREEFLAGISELEKEVPALTGKALNKSGRDLYKELEPIVIVDWGQRRIQLAKQVLRLRTDRLKLWEDELIAHKSFLTVKKEDFVSRKKRSKMRQKLLKSYFRIKNSRQSLNGELVRMENEHWKASEQMKFQLSSLYRRIAYLDRVVKGKQTNLKPKEQSPYNPGTKKR